MKLAIFDLDNTLLAGDSDYRWGCFLTQKGVVNADEYEAANADFYAQYKAGKLDITEFLEFALAPLAKVPFATLQQWHQEFMASEIQPIILPQGRDLIEKHRRLGHTLLILTATNDCMTTPIAAELGIEHIIATRAEKVDGEYSGRVSGTPSFQHGKITRLDEWLTEQKLNAEESWFYSDSINDLPLLEQVDHPYAVDPDEQLEAAAKQRGWPVMSLREADQLGIER